MGWLGNLIAPLFGDVFGRQGFDAGRQGRRMQMVPSANVAVNDLIKRYGRTLLGRSRYLSANNPYTAAAKDVFASTLAGYGIKPSSLGETPEDKKAIQELWFDWVDVSDKDGALNFYGQQRQVAEELFDAGEVFIELITGAAPIDDLPPLQLKLIPAEMLPFEHNVPKASKMGNYISMGIEFDSDGNRVGYWFTKENPGDGVTTMTIGDYRFIPADRIIHVFKPVRAGAIRGVPFTLASLTTLAMMDAYDDAELERKRTAALFTAFVKRKVKEDGFEPGPLGDPGGGAGTASADSSEGNPVSMEAGAIIDLADGEDVSFGTPADVGANYEAFQYRMILRAAAGFGVPYSEMTGDLRKANYGSQRAGMLTFRRRITPIQDQQLIHQFSRPIWNKWLDLAALFNLAPWSAAEYVENRRLHRRVKWIKPRWEWIDPLKDIQAEKIAVDNGFKARVDVIEETGADPEETDARILASRQSEMTMRDELDGTLPFGPAAEVIQVQDEPPPEDDDESGGNPDGDDEDPTNAE